MNELLTYEVLQAVLECGTREFVVCAGSRNVSFVDVLSRDERLVKYYWPEERSGAYFALGRSRLTGRPVAVVTTAGTAAGELLPAAMEAHYSGVPLILITADRPRTFRGSGAPQAAEQVGLYGRYAPFALDLSAGEKCSLAAWSRSSAAHLNVCLEEPQSQPPFQGRALKLPADAPFGALSKEALQQGTELLNRFFEQVERPLVIVSTIEKQDQESVVQFLLELNAPVLLEGISGLREEPRLQHLSLRCMEQVLRHAEAMGYAIDGILRIGGVPTHRIWRDLEYCHDRIKVCALSKLPFSGLSWSRCVAEAPIDQFLAHYRLPRHYASLLAERWVAAEQEFYQLLMQLFQEEPCAEPALVHFLSHLIPAHSHVYLGNSLPIREWDIAATMQPKGLDMRASRGLNGIEGQISTFLGLSQLGKENWALIGDLTALYDLAGLWGERQMPAVSLTLALINNGGGQIFSRIFTSKLMLNEHSLSFEPLAQMWGMPYQRLERIPEQLEKASKRFLEIVPDPAATARFWSAFAKICQFKEFKDVLPAEAGEYSSSR